MVGRAYSRAFCILRRIAVSFVLPIIIFCSCNNPNLSLEAGSNVANIEIVQLDGTKKTLSEFTGKPYVLLFWASWCTTCKSEMPSLIRLKERFQSKGFEIVAVAINDNPDKIKKYLSENKLNFFVGYDPTGQSAEHFKLTGVPEAFIVDKDGKLTLIQDPESGDAVVKIIGPREWDRDLLASQVNRLLS